MSNLGELYRSALDRVGPASRWSDDWRRIGVSGGFIYLVVLALRLSFYGRWDHPELWVAGERVMATHDAYYWLAKAKGVGLLSGYPMAELARWLHDLFGMGYGTIGFWTPAFLASLVGVVGFLWGWFLGGVNAGVLAGVMGSLTPGFFYRSRLGYFDTDLFTLLMPMLIAWMLAYWASGLMRRGWFIRDDSPVNERPGPQLWMAFAFGLATRFACIWHHDILNLAVLYVFLTVGVLVVSGRAGSRSLGFQGVIVFILAAFPGGAFGRLQLLPFSRLPVQDYGIPYTPFVICLSIFLAAGGALLFSYAQRRSHLFKNVWLSLLLLGLVVYATDILNISAYDALSKILEYLRGAGSPLVKASGAVLGPEYPSILQSIIEVKLAPVAEVMRRGLFFPWLFCAAMASGVVVVLLRPAAVFLLPMIALQLASVGIGIRFSMFGGAALSVMLGVALYWLIGLFSRRYAKAWRIDLGAQAVLGIGVLVYCLVTYSSIPMTPVLTREHAEALVALGERSAPDSRVWTWWDWGYATQYYAGRETVADGGKHDGRDVFPVAYVMTTPYPDKANRMVAFSAQYPVTKASEVGLSPARKWDTIPRDEISEALEQQLSRQDYPTTPTQYLVVTWKDMALAEWITYFGNWNLKTGITEKGRIKAFEAGELGFHAGRGAVMDRKGGGGLISDMTVLDRDGVDRTNYPMNSRSPQLLPETTHLMINMVSRQSVLMDRTVYRSTMRRLLTGDPDDPEITPYFRLVVDKLPFARIYEVLQ
jgi:dolichyl-diphosphooligosaccharide--protein glycosyltransferase